LCFYANFIAAHGFVCIPFHVLSLNFLCLQVDRFFESPKIWSNCIVLQLNWVYLSTSFCSGCVLLKGVLVPNIMLLCFVKCVFWFVFKFITIWVIIDGVSWFAKEIHLMKLVHSTSNLVQKILWNWTQIGPRYLKVGIQKEINKVKNNENLP
jgi:hypothetical protein